MDEGTLHSLLHTLAMSTDYTTDHHSIYMVKIMCGNLKMDFDLAKANLLEITEALQFLHKYFKKVERLEREMDGDAEALADLAEVKGTITRAKESMRKLHNKLSKNTKSASEGLILLQRKLQKSISNYETLCKQHESVIKLQEKFQCLRRKRSDVASPYMKHLVENRTEKLNKLLVKQKSLNLAIKSSEMEKNILQESCSVMEAFLEDTRHTIQQMRMSRTTPTKEGSVLLQWCATATTSKSVPTCQEYGIDDTVVAYEYLNPPDAPNRMPRLVLTVSFTKLKCVVRRYSIVDVKCNIDSLDIARYVDVAIARNDIVYLLTHVDQEWVKHVNMLMEVIVLRERFPVDWIGECRRLHVLLGQHKNIVFTVSLPDGYPTKGRARLEKVESKYQTVQLTDFQEQAEGESLETWIENVQTSVDKIIHEPASDSQFNI